MNGKQRIRTALEVKEPDCVPLYIHGINEAPIIGIGKHLTDGLPEPKDFRLMSDADKLKLVDTLFMIHEQFDIDGMTTFEIGHEIGSSLLLILVEIINESRADLTPCPIDHHDWCCIWLIRGEALSCFFMHLCRLCCLLCRA